MQITKELKTILLGHHYLVNNSIEKVQYENYAYLKIGEGCSNKCAYCAIPLIRGDYYSYPKETILADARRLISLGKKEIVHVKNTGRCKELLIEGCTIYLAEADNQNRKTRYDLVAVEKIRGNKPPLLINMDSQIPNSAAEEWLKRGVLFSENAVIKREVTYGSSRFDFYIEDCGRRIFLEVKGVTLENDGTAMFPDAPTERGVKHINELIKCIDDGFEA